MGDTGSMALGGAIAGLAVMTQTEVLLIFIGGIYLIEALSVMIQVASFKRTGRRVFVMAPIHHHFEMNAVGDEDHGALLDRGAIFCTTGFVLFTATTSASSSSAVAWLRRPASRPDLPVAVAICVMVIWGATPILTRVALDDLPPLVVACLRTIIAGLAAIPLLAAMRQRPPSDRESRTLLGISAAVGFVIFPVVYTLGQQHTSALHGVMILAALPIFTGIYAAIVVRQVPRRAWLVGCAVALAGEAVLIGGRGTSTGGATLGGDLIVLAAALCVSAGYVAGAMLPPRGLSSLATTLWGVLLGTIVLAPLAAGLFVRDGVPDAGAKAWAAVFFLAIITSIVGYIGWYWALDRGGIARIATLQFLQPVSGSALAAIVLGESVTLPIAIGSALIVGGIVVAQRT